MPVVMQRWAALRICLGMPQELGTTAWGLLGWWQESTDTSSSGHSRAPAPRGLLQEHRPWGRQGNGTFFLRRKPAPRFSQQHQSHLPPPRESGFARGEEPPLRPSRPRDKPREQQPDPGSKWPIPGRAAGRDGQETPARILGSSRNPPGSSINAKENKPNRQLPLCSGRHAAVSPAGSSPHIFPVSPPPSTPPRLCLWKGGRKQSLPSPCPSESPSLFSFWLGCLTKNPEPQQEPISSRNLALGSLRRITPGCRN